MTTNNRVNTIFLKVDVNGNKNKISILLAIFCLLHIENSNDIFIFVLSPGGCSRKILKLFYGTCYYNI